MSIRACVLTWKSLGCSKTTIIPPFYFLPLFALPGDLNWPLKGYFEDIFGKKSCIKMWSTIGFLPLGEFPQQNGFVLEHFLQIHSYPQVSVHCLKPLQFTSYSLSPGPSFFLLVLSSLVTFSGSLGVPASSSWGGQMLLLSVGPLSHWYLIMWVCSCFSTS